MVKGNKVLSMEERPNKEKRERERERENSGRSPRGGLCKSDMKP